MVKIEKYNSMMSHITRKTVDPLFSEALTNKPF